MVRVIIVTLVNIKDSNIDKKISAYLNRTGILVILRSWSSGDDAPY